jgi:hypothetical protein
MLVRDKHSSLLDPFISYAQNGAVNTHPGSNFTKLSAILT